jgi:uncharacterized protein (DUF302 family)
MSVSPGEGLVTRPCRRSLEETQERLEGMLRRTKLVIFGHPKAGTPLMIASPSVAIDLSLKILLSEDADGRVWLTYNAAAYLQMRQDLPRELLDNIAVVEQLAARASE